MVKNFGGNKSKKFGRKFLQQNINENKFTRFIQDDGELYAAVSKLYGGPNCEVICSDGLTRLCVIRNKFRGRGKRDNIINPGTWVLVGTRDWETESNKLPRCDLLAVYSANDKDLIKNHAPENLKHLYKIGEVGNFDNNDNDNYFDFTDTNSTPIHDTDEHREHDEHHEHDDDDWLNDI